MLWTTLLVSCAALLVGLVLARRILRPIHVINSGLMKLRPRRESRQHRSAARRRARRRRRIVQSHQREARRAIARPADGGRHPRSAEPAECDDDSPRARARAPATAAAQLARARRRRAGSRGPRRTAPDVDGAREHIDVIASEIKRLDEVITGFVRFIRPEELQLQPVNVQSLINEVIALVEPDARRSGIICRADVSDGLPELRADPALLRQALLNLALNGCQAMPNGGKLTMGATAGEGSPDCSDGRRYGRRYFSGQARPDFRPLLHDEAGRQRHRSFDRV